MFERLYDAVLNGDREAAVDTIHQTLEDGADPQELIDRGMIPAMDEVGRRFEDGEYFVPELLLAARAMKAAFELLRPLLLEGGAEPEGRVVIGTVKGDLHDIGKDIVAALLEGAGFEVVDLGTDVAPGQFVDAAREAGVDIVGLSALLTVTMLAMKSTVEAFEKAGLRDQVKVMIGGAPITEAFAQDIRADAYADNAVAAVRVAKQLIGN